MKGAIRGYEGVQSRIAEIQARLASLEGKKAAPPTPPPTAKTPLKFNKSNFDSTLKGVLDGLGGNEAFNPIGNSSLTTAGSGQIMQMVIAAAEKHGLDPKLFTSLVEQESAFNPNAVSSAGAKGLTQLMPKTAASLGVTDPFDPVQNLEGGARYLAQMLKQFDGNLELALAAYNAGPGAVSRAGGIPPFKETQNYVKKILDRYQKGER